MKSPIRCRVCSRALTMGTRWLWGRNVVCRDCLFDLACGEVELSRGDQLLLPGVEHV